MPRTFAHDIHWPVLDSERAQANATPTPTVSIAGSLRSAIAALRDLDAPPPAAPQTPAKTTTP